MASQTAGIQQLLAAEKRAAEKVVKIGFVGNWWLVIINYFVINMYR
jgi:hypothetical protein